MKMILLFLIIYCSPHLLFGQIVTDFEAIPLTSTEDFAAHPAFSHDGSQIVFSSEINGFEQLFILDLATQSTRQLTFARANSRHPSWHPNGEQVIYDSDINGKSQLYALNIESAASHLLFNRDIEARAGQFNSRANLLVFVGKESNQKHWNIYSYDFIYNNLNKISSHNSDCYFPKWSPEAAYISYHRTVYNNQANGHIMHWYGKKAFDPSSNNSYMSDISWSPTGYKIVFVTKKNDIYQLLISRRDGTEIQLLASSSHAIIHPDWSPDGQNITFTLAQTAEAQNIWLLMLE
jgi:Tol biopolymer transport system component